jgi:5-methylcytosine-specific restriction protein B
MPLDEQLLHDVRNTHQTLYDQGTLPTRAKLAEYYATFRERFGPQRLANLDGEDLLNIMHAHGNRDSLVYWLEFKDDEEFPSASFGSIAGGSAFKFGIFQRKETGNWVTGSPQKQREIAVDAAIQIARKHRDQLLHGVRLLEAFPENGSDDDYAGLQERMNSVAPDVSNLAWGHKYFSLLYPDKLDDYHNPSYQRFHLIKLLQEPPAGEGRYLVAGRYVAIAHALDIPLNHLTMMLNRLHGNPYRYWRVSSANGGGSGIRSPWELMRTEACIALGWPQVGDLSDIAVQKGAREQLRRLIMEQYPNTPQVIGIYAYEFLNFINGMRSSDLVVVSDRTQIVGVGRITGEYFFETASPFPHRRAVEWLSLEPWNFPERDPALQMDLREIKDSPANQVAIERHIHFAAPTAKVESHAMPERSTTPRGKPPALPGIAGRIQAVLERKQQVILYGPPGTGKTYWATRAAHDLAAYAAYGLPYDQLTAEQQIEVRGDDQTPGQVRVCIFHPAYGYEDFLEGYRPTTDAGQMTFTLRDGIFKQVCAAARRQPARRFYLIIDEINRGDIPRIFGELLMVLEKNKRGTAIVLPLSQQPFVVPENVYLIGTMNTADRSIALLDTALRRRFGFIELMPDSGVLGDAVVGGLPLGPWLDGLNQRIRAHIGRDARNLQVGHSYLMEGARPVTEIGRFTRIVREDILPLLQEYCYEDYATLQQILGRGLVDVRAQQIKHDLFDPTRQEDLIQALLEPDPEIATTARTIAAEADVADDAADDENIDPDTLSDESDAQAS